MKSRCRRGVSVLEALLVVAIGAMIVIVILQLVNFATKSFGRATQRLDPRETASRIQLAVRRHLVDAAHYLIGDDGRQVMFVTPRLAGRLQFAPDSGTLTVVSLDAAAPRQEILASGVKAFSIHQLRRGILRVSLTIDRPIVQDGLASLGPLKLVDEIHCPAASRSRRIPWNRAFEPRSPGQPSAPGGPTATPGPIS